MSKDVLKDAVLSHLKYTLGKDADHATIYDWRVALSQAVRDRIVDPWFESLPEEKRAGVPKALAALLALIAAIGLITFLPVYLGAEPPIGSNMLTPAGLMLPPAATPRPPWTIAARSVMMSPKMLSVTTTS